ncbi:MAG: hypothetical protein AB7G25_17995 [Sphingomonadaceae bacterium]
MHPLPQQSLYRDRRSLPGKALALLAAICISSLLVFMLLRLGAFSGSGRKEADTIIVQLLAAEKKAGKPEETPPSPATRTKPIIPPPPVELPPVPVKLNMLLLSREEFAASDISRFPRAPADPGNGGASANEGTDDSVGTAPNGEPLYNAEWYREPTDAEMSPYLRDYATESGWAMIACRTIDRWRVEDCQELGESPPGSGLARALRLASWQFLVRPPKKGGKSLTGTWVRIRFDFTEEKRE